MTESKRVRAIMNGVIDPRVRTPCLAVQTRYPQSIARRVIKKYTATGDDEVIGVVGRVADGPAFFQTRKKSCRSYSPLLARMKH